MKKFKLVSILCAFAAVCLGSGIAATHNESVDAAAASKTVEFSMIKGASIRLRSNSNGMRFSAAIPQASYEAIESKTVSYGMLIMPEDYVTTYGELTVENVFGSNAIYDWKVEGEEYSGTKTRIINITYEDLGEVIDGEYIIRGSITNVLDANLGRDFVARAYINNNGTYTMANYADGHIIHNTRSMLDVAESALSDTSAQAISDGAKNVVKAEYMNTYEEVSTYDEFIAMKSDGRYYLANDIDFAGNVNGGNGSTNGAFLTAQSFSGRLYGYGYALNNVTIGTTATAGSYRSLFGALSGTVRDVSIEATVNDSRPIYGDAVIANKMTDGVIDNVSLNVKYEIANNKGYTEGGSWADNTKTSVSAGMVQNFLEGVIKNSTVTIETPTNVSTTDGIVAVSNVNWTAGYDNSLRMLDNVHVYAKTADVKTFVNQTYANPITVNCATHVSIADSLIVKGGENVADDVADTYFKTTKYASTSVESNLATVGNVKLAEYSQIDFAYKMTGANRNLALYSAYDGLIYEGQATEWTNISLRKQADGLWSLYVDGELYESEGKPMINLFGLYLSDMIYYAEFGGESGSADYYLSNVTAVVDEDYETPKLWRVQDCILAEGTESTDYLAEDSLASTVVTAGWNVKTLALENEDHYKYLKFYVMATESNKYFELDLSAPTGEAMIIFDGKDFANGNEVFHKFEFVKMADGSWLMYYDEQIKGNTESVNDLWLRLNGTHYFSEVFAMYADDYVRPTLPNVMDNPIAKATTEVKYDVVDLADNAILTNVIAGTWVNGGTPLNALNLAPYSEVKFLFKTDGKYFEVLNAATPSKSYYGGTPTEWTEVRLTKDGDSWKLYVAGEEKDFTCTNLNELSVQLGNDGTFYVTNLMGTYDPNYVAPEYEIINEKVFVGSATVSDETAPNGFTKVVSHSASWGVYSFNSAELKPYTEVSFAVKPETIEGNTGYFGMMYDGEVIGDETNNNGNWLTIRLVKNGEVWDLYYGEEYKDSYSVDDIADFNFRFGTKTYLVTELHGIVDTNVSAESVVWTKGEHPFKLKGEAATDDIADGFTSTTKFTTSWDKYNFKDFDLKPFSEVKFAVKPETIEENTGYFGMMYGDDVINETNNGGEWLTIRLVLNEEKWDLYYGENQQGSYMVDNLNDFNFRFGKNTYYVSELICKTDPNWSSEYTVIAKNPLKMVQTSILNSGANLDSNVANVYNCGWTPTSFVDGIVMSKYTEITFFYKVDNADKYLELCDASGNAYYAGNNFEWTEVKVLFENDAWSIYVDGVLKKAGLTGTNLSDVIPIVRLGGAATANVYLSELLGKESHDLVLLSGGASDYAIVYDSADTYGKEAAIELQTYFAKATGVTLPTQTYSSQAKNGNYIFIGNTLAEKATLSFKNLDSPSWYRVECSGTAIYVYGSHYYGTKNGVYALLNEWFAYEAYAEGVYSINDGITEMVLDPFARVGGMVFDYQFAGYGMISDLKSPDAKVDEQLGFITDYRVSGGGIHNALTLISREEYGTAHPEWFYEGTTSDGSNTGYQLYLAAEDFAVGEGTLVTTVAEKLAADVLANPQLHIISFSAMDIDIWPTGEGYEKSDALHDTYGTYSAEMIIFMNAVAKKMEGLLGDREITLQMLAYNKTLCAPSLDGLTEDEANRIMLYQGTKVKVSPYIAPVEANFTMKFDDANNTVKNPNTGVIDSGSPTVGAVIEGWEAISDGGDMFLWWYGLDCNSYFMVMDTITNMQAQYQFAKEHGITTMYVQAHYDAPVSSDWAALKIYLQSVLAKDVNADVDAAIDEFMTNYFGAAASSMKTLLEEQQTWYAKLRGNSKQDSGYNLGRLRGSAFFTASTGNAIQWTYDLSLGVFNYAKNKMINAWYDYLDEARAAINDSSLTEAEKAVYLERIEIEALTVRWVGAKVFEKESVDDVYAAAKALGFTHSAEGLLIA